jgi:hypothetical protein
VPQAIPKQESKNWARGYTPLRFCVLAQKRVERTAPDARKQIKITWTSLIIPLDPLVCPARPRRSHDQNAFVLAKAR